MLYCVPQLKQIIVGLGLIFLCFASFFLKYCQFVCIRVGCCIFVYFMCFFEYFLSGELVASVGDCLEGLVSDMTCCVSSETLTLYGHWAH